MVRVLFWINCLAWPDNLIDPKFLLYISEVIITASSILEYAQRSKTSLVQAICLVCIWKSWKIWWRYYRMDQTIIIWGSRNFCVYCWVCFCLYIHWYGLETTFDPRHFEFTTIQRRLCRYSSRGSLVRCCTKKERILCLQTNDKNSRNGLESYLRSYIFKNPYRKTVDKYIWIMSYYNTIGWNIRSFSSHESYYAI